MKVKDALLSEKDYDIVQPRLSAYTQVHSTGETLWLPLLRPCYLQYWLRRDAFRFSRFRILVSSSVPRLKRHSSSLASAGFYVERT